MPYLPNFLRDKSVTNDRVKRRAVPFPTDRGLSDGGVAGLSDGGVAGAGEGTDEALHL